MADRKRSKQSKTEIVKQPAAQLVRIPTCYAELLDDLKKRIRTAQLRAGFAVNRELNLLYWEIGRQILQGQHQEGWGAKVIDRLAQDLRREFPEMKGFSPRNLIFMRGVAEAFPEEREWYIRQTIQYDRFIDEYQSRNERLADLMRRFGICEEKGSGIDKVIDAAEAYQLPAPDFRVGDRHTIAVLFAHKEFEDMERTDRIRACYQHCCLRYVMNKKMTNQSLRERFSLTEKKAESVSRVIRETMETGLIKLSDPTVTSLRYRSYVPYWI